MQLSRTLLMTFLVGSTVALSSAAFADPDVRARVRVGPRGNPHTVVRVDRDHRPDVRVRVPGRVGVRAPGRVTVRVNPFHGRIGWHVNRFTPRERALWTHGRWWHGRHHGRFGW